jgi:heme A synthase
MNSNQGLFFYGLGANLVAGIGTLVAMFGLFAIILSVALGIILIVAGGALFLWGKSMRFDYQRQSGSIIHRGDW